MKKVISLLLSVLLVALSVTGSLVLATANSGQQETMGLAVNWKLYENKTTTIGETGTPAANWATVTDNTNTKYIHSGSSSVKFSCIAQRGATEFSVKKNTDYELSFLYYNESLNSAGTYALSQVAVVLPNGSVAKKDALAYKDGGSGTGTTITGQWQSMSLSFNSGENTTLALTVLFAATPIYIDDFYLVDKSSANPNRATNWTLYANNSKKVGSEGTLAAAWAKVSQNTNTAYMHDGAETLKFDCVSQRGAVTLPVEQNKNYELTFWCYADALNAAGTYILSQATVLVPEGEVDPKGKDCLGKAEAQALTITAKQWTKLTVPFASGSNTAVVFSLLFGSGTVYISDINLAEKSAQPQVDGVVNFEQTDKASLYYNQGDRFELQTTAGPTGDTTTALHIKAGNYSSATVLNWSTILNDTDPVYTFAVTPGATYEMTCWFKVNASAGIENDYLALMYSYAGKRTPFATLTKTTNTGKWVKYTHTFTAAADQTKCSFQLNGGKNTPECWLDDLSVKKKQAAPTPSEAEGWAVYQWDTKFVGTAGIAGPAWASVTKDTSGAHDSNGDGQSILVNAIAQQASTVLTVKKNTDYCLSFKYFVTEVNAAGTYSLSRTGITAENGAVEANKDGFYSYLGNNAAYVAKDGLIANKEVYEASTASTVTGKWQEVKIPFNSGNNEKMAFVLVSAVSKMWIDEFTLKEEKMELPQKDYGTPKDLWTIDFEDVNTQYSASNGIDVVEVMGHDGQTTKALHTVPAKRGSALFLNYKTTTTDTDPVYTIPVLPNRVYDLSWRVKIKENTGDIPWLSFYHYYQGKLTNIANLQKAKQGEWLYYSVTLITEEKQNRFSFTFNAGDPSPEIWVDDINLALTNYKAFEGYNGPQKKTVINFDDFMVPLTNKWSLEIVKGPAYNGQESNALHTIPGEYSGSQTLNYTSTTTYTDPVFTIPVKPNTLYKYSLRAYVAAPEKQRVNVEYCAVHIDFATKNILHLAPRTKGINNEWVTIEKTFVTGSGQNMISTMIDFSKNLVDFYIDDICLEELEPGILADTELSYCEEPFNTLDSTATAAVNAAKTSVTELAVEPNTMYTFGATLQGKNSQIFLSANGTDPLKASDATQSYNGTITATGTKTRTAYQLVSPSSGKLYLVIKNNGSLQLSTVQLFKTIANSGVNWDIGMAENPNIPPEQMGEVAELVAIGSVAEKQLYGADTPATGEASLLPAFLVLVCTAGIGTALFLTRNKGGKHHA